MADAGQTERAPIVSVLMANRNGAAFLEAAIKSVLGQSLKELELIIVDDASSDASRTLIEAWAKRDQRVRVIYCATPGGPARARNLALDVACGKFVAIVDADDLMHPERLGRLVGHALEDRAGIVADDLLIFESEGRFRPRRLLKGALAKRAHWIDLEAFVDANHLYASGPVTGVLKPLIARDLIESEAMRYDESLRIGEDFDFLARLMEQGVYMRLYPELGYFYRKHAGSISHRLDVGALEALRANGQGFVARAPGPDLRRRHLRRLASITRAHAYEELVARAKSGGAFGLLAQAWRSRAGLWLLRLPVLARVGRLWPRRQAKTADIVVFSHQRVIGAVNGSSRYLLDLCGELARQGRIVRLVQPSPWVFGRWPLLWLSEDTDVFEAVHVRGAWAMGRLRVAHSPSVWVRAIAALGEKALLKLGVVRKLFLAPAPSALTAPQGPEEIMFGATHAQGAQLCVADYAFLTPMLCAALNPGAPSAVIMHDLLSARREGFDAQGQSDSSATLSRARELELLNFADTIIAIQAEEAALVAQGLSHAHVITAPLAVRTICSPSAGEDAQLLFVGSNTAANRIALEWLFAEVWPKLLGRSGGARVRLWVAGSVARGLAGPLPQGVRLLGVVKDLTPLYRRAGIVISPLTVGSGLKIKLVEAMAHAKAIIATPVTLQGVDAELSKALVVAHDADAFAAAIVQLAFDEKARLNLAHSAARSVARLFAPEVCYRELHKLGEAERPLRPNAAQHARR